MQLPTGAGTTVGQLESRGHLWLKSGFPCGNTNETGQGHPQLRPLNVDDSCQVDLTEIKYVEPDRDVSRYLVRAGDVIFNNTNSHPLVGKTMLWSGRPEGFVLSNHMTILRVLDDAVCSSPYLAYQMQWLWRTGYFQRMRRQHVNQASISLQRLRETPLTLPPLPEQRAIARALKAVQAARDARRRELELERERKAALMEHLFTKGTRGEATKMTEIGEMPESWEVVELGSLATALRSGVTPRGGQSTYVVDGVPLIRSQNVLMNRLDLSDVAYITEETHRGMARSLVVPGDVLLNITGASIGRVAYVPADTPEANVNQHVCRVRLRANAVPAYVSHYLSSERGQQRILGAQFGTTRQGLNYGQVRSLPLPLPTAAEQEAIASGLLACGGAEDALSKEIALLDELFRAMLEELMTGRLSAVALIEETEGEAGTADE